MSTFTIMTSKGAGTSFTKLTTKDGGVIQVHHNSKTHEIIGYQEINKIFVDFAAKTIIWRSVNLPGCPIARILERNMLTTGDDIENNPTKTESIQLNDEAVEGIWRDIEFNMSIPKMMYDAIIA